MNLQNHQESYLSSKELDGGNPTISLWEIESWKKTLLTFFDFPTTSLDNSEKIQNGICSILVRFSRLRNFEQPLDGCNPTSILWKNNFEKKPLKLKRLQFSNWKINCMESMKRNRPASTYCKPLNEPCTIKIQPLFFEKINWRKNGNQKRSRFSKYKSRFVKLQMKRK